MSLSTVYRVVQMLHVTLSAVADAAGDCSLERDFLWEPVQVPHVTPPLLDKRVR